MMLTTSDRTRYGRLVDPDQAFRDWLEAHDHPARPRPGHAPHVRVVGHAREAVTA